MKILVLGCGLQGRAVVSDLARSTGIEAVTVADADLPATADYVAEVADERFRAAGLDAADPAALRAAIDGHDIAIDMLPRQFLRAVCQAAIDVGAHLINAMYDRELRDLGPAAAARGIIVLPEMGMDPGIDLVLAGEGARRFDEVYTYLSYGGGIPERSAADNPLQYKISWIWEGVLNSYWRDARQVVDGQVVDIPAAEIFAPREGEIVRIDGIGELEAFPNGDAWRYVELLGCTATVRTAGRYALRWPGHKRIWRAFAALGFLEQGPVPGLPGGISPRDFMARHLEPRLQYRPDERDLVVIRVEVGGRRDGRCERVVFEVIDYRDLTTGLLAMNRTVGFPASIAAQMIGDGRITGRGLLSPLRDVPYEPFLAELRQRGIEARETVFAEEAIP